jgi:outer membrane protein assembly factor BamE (lipoprotein component of BamABCDE complex)
MRCRSDRKSFLPAKRAGLPISLSLLGFSLLILAACSPPVETRGNPPDPVILGEVTPGKTTKDQVEALLGTPSSIAPFSKNTWYYIGQKTERFAFFDPEILDQQVVAVVFDDKGTVSQIHRFNQKDGWEVEVVERETPTRGKELTFARALLGTLGILSRDSLNSGSGYTKEGK